MKRASSIDNHPIARRMRFNRAENEKVYHVRQIGKTIEQRTEFQGRLLDAMFSVIDAEDFLNICIKIDQIMREETMN